jgi:hypothetical protein
MMHSVFNSKGLLFQGKKKKIILVSGTKAAVRVAWPCVLPNRDDARTSAIASYSQERATLSDKKIMKKHVDWAMSVEYFRMTPPTNFIQFMG